jgi:hypothetical protein
MKESQRLTEQAKKTMAEAAFYTKLEAEMPEYEAYLTEKGYEYDDDGEFSFIPASNDEDATFIYAPTCDNPVWQWQMMDEDGEEIAALENECLYELLKAVEAKKATLVKNMYVFQIAVGPHYSEEQARDEIFESFYDAGIELLNLISETPVVPENSRDNAGEK